MGKKEVLGKKEREIGKRKITEDEKG